MFQTLKVSPKATCTVEAIPLSRVLAVRHTVSKMDVEGAKLQLFATPRNWRNARLMIIEFSGGRCKHYGVGPLAFASMLDLLPDGGRTHFHLDVKIGTVKFWLREQCARNLDFILFCTDHGRMKRAAAFSPRRRCVISWASCLWNSGIWKDTWNPRSGAKGMAGVFYVGGGGVVYHQV